MYLVFQQNRLVNYQKNLIMLYVILLADTEKELCVELVNV